jgi:hypothetical protein
MKQQVLNIRICVCILTLVIQHSNSIFYALYYVLSPVWIYHIIPRYLKMTRFSKTKFVKHIIFFILSTTYG